MKIGKLVKRHIKQIFFHCDNVEHDEIYSLLDPKYSKNTFGVNFPFCIELENIEQSQSKRYWTEIYLFRGKRVRVTSQWFETSKSLFIKYLESRKIVPDIDQPEYERKDKQQAQSPSSRANSRYRGNLLGMLRIFSLEIFSAALGLSLSMKKTGLPQKIISRLGAPIVMLKQNY